MRKRLNRTYRISKYVLHKETKLDWKNHIWSFIGACVGIGVIAGIQSLYLDEIGNIFLIGSFGASSVLIFGAIESPLAQMRNLIGGHFVSAFVGVLASVCLPDILWLKAPIAVGLSIVAMQFTKTIHPPGGATALIAVSGGAKIEALGFLYVLFPVLTGSIILAICALICNNRTTNRQYPKNKSRILFGYLPKNK